MAEEWIIAKCNVKKFNELDKVSKSHAATLVEVSVAGRSKLTGKKAPGPKAQVPLPWKLS
jgi:hypothetical protein